MKQKPNLNSLLFAPVQKKFKAVANSLLVSENQIELVLYSLENSELQFLNRFCKKRNFQMQITAYINTLFISVTIHNHKEGKK